MNRHKFLAMLVAGGGIGLLSCLPLVGWFWFLWATLGGVTATWLLLRQWSQPATYADGAVIGLGAGGIGGTLNLIGTIGISVVSITLQNASLSTPDKVLAKDINATFGAVVVVTQFLWNLGLVIPIVFLACIGGLIGCALFERNHSAPKSATPHANQT